MTVAICIRCGTVKRGALTPCPKCEFDPESNEDKAKAMLLTDHYLPEEQLKAIGDEIQNGKTPKFPEDILAEQIRFFEEHPDIEREFSRGCVIFGLVAIAVVAAAIWLAIR